MIGLPHCCLPNDRARWQTNARPRTGLCQVSRFTLIGEPQPRMEAAAMSEPYRVQYLPLPLDLDALISPVRRVIVLNSSRDPHRRTIALRQARAFAASATPPGHPAPCAG